MMKQKTIFIGLVLLLMAACSQVSDFQDTNSSTTESSSETPILLTANPQVVANQTQAPDTNAGVIDETVNIRQMIESCEDYSEQRRDQMLQHLTWLDAPDDIPSDVMLALGTNPTGRLVFGMATFTSIEWRLAERPIDSCLVPIGILLDELLGFVGERPLGIYESDA